MPDIIVMDGGKTQIGVCKEIIDSLHLNITIIGLVKNDKHKKVTYDFWKVAYHDINFKELHEVEK